MNIIEFAINEVEQRIPKEVLKYAFLNISQNGILSPVNNIKTQIRNKVVFDRVLPILNIKGGEEVIINLTDVPVEITTNGNAYIWKVPKGMTKGRTIRSVLNITFSDTMNNIAGNMLTNNMYASNQATIEARIVNSGGLPVLSSTADIFVIADNVLYSNLPLSSSSYTMLRCLIDFDPQLTGINTRFATLFAKYIVLATKDYIYTSTVVSMDQGVLHIGKELGRIKDIIDGYDGADEEFIEMTDTIIGKVLILADPLRRQRRYLLGVGGGWV